MINSLAFTFLLPIESNLNTQACMQACLCSLNQAILANYTYYLVTLQINLATLRINLTTLEK